MELLYPHCAGLDVHKNSVVACVRHMVDGKITTRFKTLKTTTSTCYGASEVRILICLEPMCAI